MKLLKLVLENFQGIKKLEINAEGKDVIIKGDNGTGKTSVANALTWLLYDKASTGEKGYTPKTTDENGDEVHYLHHSAEGTFKKENGNIITLKREFYENWQKVRGSTTDTFRGNVTDHYIDGVPVKEKEYKDVLNEICEPEQAMMLTMPEYFADVLPWQKRREILLDVCGDITDEDVIKNTAELADLPKYLLKLGTEDQYYTVDEYAAIAKAKKAEINKDLQMIPARIDEAKKAMPVIEALDADAIDGAIAKAEVEKEDLEQQKGSLVLNATSNMRKELSDVEANMADARRIHNENNNKTNESTQNEIKQLQSKIFEINSTIRELGHQKDTKADKIKTLTEKREGLAQKYTEIQSEIFQETAEFSMDTVCPTCGQAIPEDRIQEAKDKFEKVQQEKREQFNLDKSQRLEEINKQGQSECSKTMIEAIEKEMDDIASEIGRMQGQENELNDNMETLKAKLIAPIPFEETEEYKKFAEKVAQVKTMIDNDTNNITEQKDAIQRKIDSLNQEIQAMNDNKLSIRYAQSQQDRINKLMEQEKKLASDYEYIDRGVWLTEEFTRAKAKMLTDKINSKFETIRFKLFTTQVNGGQADTCEVLVQTTEGLKQFKKANSGARINGGIEITKVLSDHWGISMPLILDNCESVTRIHPTTAQQIRMYVSEAHPKLTIDTERALKMVKGA